MRNPGGYAVVVQPDEDMIERDTVTCAHCNCIVTVNPKLDPMKQTQFRVIEAECCRMCMHHVCPVCAGQMKCEPFEKKLEGMERRYRNERAMLGLKY